MTHDPDYDAYLAEREADKWHAQAESAVDQMLKAQEECDRMRRRLEAAERLARAVADFLPDRCASDNSVGIFTACICDILTALAAYRETSK